MSFEDDEIYRAPRPEDYGITEKRADEIRDSVVDGWIPTVDKLWKRIADLEADLLQREEQVADFCIEHGEHVVKARNLEQKLIDVRREVLGILSDENDYVFGAVRYAFDRHGITEES